jgi:hypothetical protein
MERQFYTTSPPFFQRLTDAPCGLEPNTGTKAATCRGCAPQRLSLVHIFPRLRHASLIHIALSLSSLSMHARVVSSEGRARRSN